MEILVAIVIGTLTACGIYLLLRPRTFSVVLGLSLLSYAVNLFLLSMGRLGVNMPSVVEEGRIGGYVDPLPQALILTAIVISFGMTALTVVLALRSYLESESDHVDLSPQMDIAAGDGT